jgi:hypothetical protein
MTPEQALEILSQVAANAQCTLQQHYTLQEALKVIKELLPKEEKVEDNNV